MVGEDSSRSLVPRFAWLREIGRKPYPGTVFAAGLRAGPLRDDHQHLGLLPAEAADLMRSLAGDIEAVALRRSQLLAIELDGDPAVDDEQHLLAGMRCPERRFERRAQQERLHHLSRP